jgi:arylsulfatase A-like enzyme/Tfp pilus assembly protein PilF
LKRALALLLLFACSRAETPAPTETSSDIILVTIDTLRADSTGFGGNARVKTPFLDSVAARGAVFANAHAHNVVTLPSHANILTGRYPFQHGIRDNAGFVLEPRFETIATALKRAGYTTGAFVGAFPLDKRFGLNQGFDVYDDNYGKGQASFDFTVQERRADAVLQAASKWWSANAGRKRFLWVHVYDPHAPYAAPEPFASEYRDAPYLGEIAYVDHVLQASLQPLLTPQTLVVITADHGEALGDHGERTHGLFAYESTLKVPLLVAGPGIAARKVTEAARHIDIAPTILESAGASIKDLPGVSLLHPASRETYFEALSASLNRGWAPLTGILRDDVKYIDLPIAELYDLGSDAREERNVADDRRRDVDAARKVLRPMLAAAASTGTRNVSAETLANLRSLGYVAGNAPIRANYTAADDPKNLVHLDNKMHDAVIAFERGRPQEALALAQEIVQERGDMTAGREMLALMLRQNYRLDEAIAELERLCAQPMATDDNRIQLALLLSETGRASRAVELLTPHASSTNPDIINAYGVALADASRTDAALAQFRRALQLDPNNAPAMQNIGIAALRANDVAAAQQNLNAALALNERLPLAWNALGVVRARNNDLAGAVDAWKRAVALDPRQYDALFNIGVVTFRAGKTADARAALTRFVETAPPSRYARDIAQARQALASLTRR